MIGFIKLHRQLLDSATFNNTIEQMIFAWLILRAQWKDTTVRYKGRMIYLKRGQLALSYRDFAQHWDWNEVKCRRYIGRLQRDAVVSAASDAGVNVITILNYNKFQDSEIKNGAVNGAVLLDEVTQDRRTSDAQNKEDNNIIKDIKKPKGKKGSRIPDDWACTRKLADWANKKGYTDHQVKAEEEKFKLYWEASTGAKAIKLNWDKTFQSWMLNAYSVQPDQGSMAG